ncbi:MAG: hypothetical protein ACRC6E_02550 [Fusobacteriaceae bacterium]
MLKKVATVQVYENKNEVRTYGFMAGDQNTPVMEIRFNYLFGEDNLSVCKLRWVLVDDIGTLLVGEVNIGNDNRASIQLPNSLFLGKRKMKVQLTLASADGTKLLNLQQFTDLNVIDSLISNTETIPVYDVLINALHVEAKAQTATLGEVFEESKIMFEQMKSLMLESQLNTPYYSTKMQQEGVYEDFIEYMDLKIPFDKEQEEIKNINSKNYKMIADVEQDLTYEEFAKKYTKDYKVKKPKMKKNLIAFMNKYKLV